MAERGILELLRSEMTLRTSTALAQSVTDLISSGGLLPGDRLPTVRMIADELGMSRSAVGNAWSDLSARGLIETRRRGGTRVLGKPMTPRALRYEAMIRSTMRDVRDLGNIRVESPLYPNLSRAMEWAISRPRFNELFDLPVTSELNAAVQETWPFAGAQFLATHGLMDSVELVMSTLIRPGDTVLVESPTFGRILDVLEALGAIPWHIDFRETGPDLEELKRALVSKPVAFIYQPAGQVPSGRSVSSEWLHNAAEMLPSTLPIIEVSQFPPLHPEDLSLGALLPNQVTLIRSYTLFYGPEIRAAVVGGSAELIDAMWMRLTYSTRHVSRILQGALAFLMTDESSKRNLHTLSAEILSRHEKLKAALAKRDVLVENTRGPCMWIPVPGDQIASMRLAQRGVAVYPGRLFQSSEEGKSRIHLNSAAVAGDHEEVAELIVEACNIQPNMSS